MPTTAKRNSDATVPRQQDHRVNKPIQMGFIACPDGTVMRGTVDGRIPRLDSDMVHEFFH